MFKVVNESDRATVYLYDRIGKSWYGEGTSAREFCDALKEVEPKPLDLHIDSGGGDVFEGYAMCSAISRYEGHVTAHVDGLAASAASFIAVMCDDVVMSDYAYMMIHKASTYAIGNADEIEAIIPRLRQMDETIAGIYEKRSNLTMAEALDYMADETWFTAEEAHEHGLCTEVAETEERMAACLERDLANRYEHVPEGVQVADERKAIVLDGNTMRMTSPFAQENGVRAGVIAAGTLPGGPAGGGESHADPIIVGNEGTDATGAILLGNRIYRKEN